MGDHESEGRWRQISGLTNRNHIRLQLRIRLHFKSKSNNYSELTVVNVAEWLRHRIRAIYWKQWKKSKTKYRKLKELGMDEKYIQWHANMRQGIWNCSSNRMVQFALNNAKLREWGYPTFTEFYLKICEN